jgi:hypothetical protein
MSPRPAATMPLTSYSGAWTYAANRLTVAICARGHRRGFGSVVMRAVRGRASGTYVRVCRSVHHVGRASVAESQPSIGQTVGDPSTASTLRCVRFGSPYIQAHAGHTWVPKRR